MNRGPCAALLLPVKRLRHALKYLFPAFDAHPLKAFLPMNIKQGLPALAWLFLLVATAVAQEAASDKASVIVPTEKIDLFNGRDLTNWYTWLDDDHYEDRRGVFTVQKDGILRISGDGFGGLTTKREYANYYLVLEYRWGTETFGSRKDRARDGGLLLHCQGADGNFGGSAEKRGPWMTSLECQIIEGGVGDILVLRGTDPQGKPMIASATCEITRDRDNEAVWTPGGKREVFSTGRINWEKRDPDWKDALGVRGPHDVDSPGQEWTTLECFCRDNTLTYRVNGVVVNRATDVTPSHGKILLQTEGAEMFVRRLELQPLPKEVP